MANDLIEEATILAMKGDALGMMYVLADAVDSRMKIRNLRIREALDQRNLGNNQRAEEILRLAICDAGGGTLLGELYHHLGTNAQGVRNFSKALNYLNITYHLRKDSGDLLGAAYSAFQIPMCKKMSGAPDENLIAEFQEARAAVAAAMIENPNLAPEHLSNMKQNLAFCLQAEGKYQDALTEYQQLLPLREMAETNKDPLERRLVAMTCARIAECCFALGQIDRAREEAERALRIFEYIEDKNRIKQVRELMTKIEEAEEPNSAP